MKIIQGNLVEFCPFAVNLETLQKKSEKEQKSFQKKTLSNLRKICSNFGEHSPFCPRLDEIKQNYVDFRDFYGLEKVEEWDNSHCLCREIAIKFASKNARYNHVTYNLGRISSDIEDRNVDILVWVDLYLLHNVGIICLSIPIDGYFLNEVIALKKFFFDKENNNNHEIIKLCKTIISCIDRKDKQVFDFNFDYNAVEINEIKDIDNVAEKSFVEEHEKQLYGLLSCDEGYNYVPNDLAKTRLTEYHWRTRTFQFLYAFGKQVVMLNAKHQVDDYISMQTKLNKLFHQENRNYYFEMKPCIACIDHSVFEIIEKNICISVEAKQLQEEGQKDGNIEKKRKKLLEYVYRKAPSQIEELNELNRLLSEAFGTKQLVDALLHRLELISEDASQKKQYLTNILLIILSLFTAIAGVLAILPKG